MNTVSEHSQRRPAGHSPQHGHAKPDPHIIVLFGATGDLAKRKLLPGLHHLFRAGLLPEEFRVIGSSPQEFALSDADFRTRAEQACQEFGNCKPDGSWDSFASRLSFGAGLSCPLQAVSTPRSVALTIRPRQV